MLSLCLIPHMVLQILSDYSNFHKLTDFHDTSTMSASTNTLPELCIVNVAHIRTTCCLPMTTVPSMKLSYLMRNILKLRRTYGKLLRINENLQFVAMGNFNKTKTFVTNTKKTF